MLSEGSETVTSMPYAPRYHDDFFAWTQHQAMVLRTMGVTDNRFDRENVAEEIEDLGRSERAAVLSQIRRIIEHLLQLAHSPAEQPGFDWMASIVEARATLGDKISATLRRDVENMLSKLYEDGRDPAELWLRSHGEMQVANNLPRECPYTLEDILRRGWYPDELGGKP
jgi:hypothetical protein